MTAPAAEAQEKELLLFQNGPQLHVARPPEALFEAEDAIR